MNKNKKRIFIIFIYQ